MYGFEMNWASQRVPHFPASAYYDPMKVSYAGSNTFPSFSTPDHPSASPHPDPSHSHQDHRHWTPPPITDLASIYKASWWQSILPIPTIEKSRAVSCSSKAVKPNMLEMGRTCRTCCDNLACVQYQHVLFYCLLVVCLIVCCLFGVNILVKTVWSQGSSLFIRRQVVGKCRKTRIVVVWKVVQDAGVGWILEGGCFGHPAQVSLHPPERCGFRPCKTD